MNPADLESDGQRLVASPVGGQHGAQEVGAVGLHQLAGMVGDHLKRQHPSGTSPA